MISRTKRILIIFLVVVLVAVAIIYLNNWNKYNSLSPEEKFYKNNDQHLVEEGVYSWPKIGFKIKVPANYKAMVEPMSGGYNDSERPTNILIYRNATNEIISGSDMMTLNVRDFQGTVDNFIEYAQSSKNSGSYFTDRNRTPLGLLKINNQDAKWFRATSIYPTASTNVYEVYFVNKYRGFILVANYNDWTKAEIEQIVNGITLE